MAEIVKLPKCGINMEEGIIIRFLVKEGDEIRAEQPLAELETDKMTTEITSPTDGFVLRLLCETGQPLPILTPVLAIGAQGETFGSPDEAPTGACPPSEEKQAAAGPAPTTGGARPDGSRVRATPLAKKVAEELGVDLFSITGSGPEGGILRRDVLRFAENRPAESVLTRGPALASPWDLPVAHRIPVRGMRKAIADNMTRSKALIPHFQLSADVDMTAAMALRDKIRQQRGLRVSYNDILTLATAWTMAAVPAVNASFTGNEILEYVPVNVGIAVGLDDGLIVPVLHNVQNKSLRQIAEESAALIQNARAGKLSPADCTGGTVTLSNLGMYEVDRFTAIINPPESCILAIGRIAERPVGIDGRIELRPMMTVTASFDHRVVDGAVGARFLTEFKRCLEDPCLLLV